MFRQEEALEICQEFIDKHQLKLDILGARVGEERIVFLFHSPKRVDFKSLTADLQDALQMPVHFEPVDARTKARLTGGIGPCGQVLCCLRWLGEVPKECLKNVSGGKKGICGKPRCCLIFEQTGALFKKNQKSKIEEKKHELKTKDKEIQKKKQAPKVKKDKPRKKRVRRLRV